MRGNYAPVADEATLTDLQVEGRVPDGLEGVYLRNGPNPPASKGVPAIGSSATACCTASGSAAARRTGIATAGSARRWKAPR